MEKRVQELKMNILPKESNWQSSLGQALSQAMEKQAQQRRSEQDFISKAMFAQQMKDIPMQRAEKVLSEYAKDPSSENTSRAIAWGGSRAGAKIQEDAIKKRNLKDEIDAEKRKLGIPVEGDPDPNQQPQELLQGDPNQQQQIDPNQQPQELLQGDPNQPQQIDPNQQQVAGAETLGMSDASQPTEKEVRQGEEEKELRELLLPGKPVEATYENYTKNMQKDLDDTYDAERKEILSQDERPTAINAKLERLKDERSRTQGLLQKKFDRAERSFDRTEKVRNEISDSAKSAYKTMGDVKKVMRLLESGDLNNPVYVGLIEGLVSDPRSKAGLFSNNQQELRAILPRFLDKEATEAIKGNLNQNEFNFLTSTLPNDKLQTEVIRRLVLYKKGEAEVAIARDVIASNTIEKNNGIPPNNIGRITDSKLRSIRKTVGRGVKRELRSKKVPESGTHMSDGKWQAIGIAKDNLPLILGVAGGLILGSPGAAGGAGLGSILKGDSLGTMALNVAEGAALGGLGKGLFQGGKAILTKGGGNAALGTLKGLANKYVGKEIFKAGTTKVGSQLAKRTGAKIATSAVARKAALGKGKEYAAKGLAKEASKKGLGRIGTKAVVGKKAARIVDLNIANAAKQKAYLAREAAQVGETVGKNSGGFILDHRGRLIDGKGKVLKNSAEILRREEWSGIDRIHRAQQTAEALNMNPAERAKYLRKIKRNV